MQSTFVGETINIMWSTSQSENAASYNGKRNTIVLFLSTKGIVRVVERSLQANQPAPTGQHINQIILLSFNL